MNISAPEGAHAARLESFSQMETGTSFNLVRKFNFFASNYNLLRDSWFYKEKENVLKVMLLCPSTATVQTRDRSNLNWNILADLNQQWTRGPWSKQRGCLSLDRYSWGQPWHRQHRDGREVDKAHSLIEQNCKS
ncbi:hypothetical protein RRG08_008280 [Elysia crispata]|uniref:Uncharacterized protein n=1 Tax=Elysia crispata TaxID=231223 RepID=A0AAE0ZMR6_9GAST|nr:hypothetical protein RRG08_008280 [Elysia crispata]